MSEARGFRDAANQSMVLTALYIAQEQYGHLDEKALERVAERLDLPVSQYRRQIVEQVEDLVTRGGQPRQEGGNGRLGPG